MNNVNTFHRVIVSVSSSPCS